MMKEIGKRLEGDSAVVFVLADDAAIGAIADKIDLGDNPVGYEVVPPETQNLIKEAVKAADALQAV